MQGRATLTTSAISAAPCGEKLSEHQFSAISASISQMAKRAPRRHSTASRNPAAGYHSEKYPAPLHAARRGAAERTPAHSRAETTDRWASGQAFAAAR
jgi:hypothetical protein